MSWRVLYHPEVDEDLQAVGPAAARRIMRAIDAKLTEAPEQFGVPLSGNLTEFRKLRIGDYRVVYQVVNKAELSSLPARTKLMPEGCKLVVVYVLAVGPRRDKEIYRMAAKRLG